MKRKKYKYLYSRLLDKNLIIRAWRNLRKGKTKRRAVKRIEENFDAEVERMYQTIYNTRPEGVPVPHPELAYSPPAKRQTKHVNERGKNRLAYLAVIREQWYFHCILVILGPIIQRRLSEHAYGSVPGRGPHLAKRRIEKELRTKKFRYYFKCDIRHFYASLWIDVVMKALREEIEDEWFLYLIEKIFTAKKGILIGLYISPWLAHAALFQLDEALSRIDGISFYRYVDDIVMFASSKKALRRVYAILTGELHRIFLKLKRNWQIIRFAYDTGKTILTASGKAKHLVVGRPLDFMGFVFYRNRTIIRRHIMLHATRLARHMAKIKAQGGRYWITHVKAMISLMGWYEHTDSYNNYLIYIKSRVNIGKLKKIISKHDKEVAERERLERGAQLQAA